MDRIANIKTRLQAALTPSSLEITDDSHLHIGHPGAQSGAGHFTVEIASDYFTGKTRLQCHRLIYDALDDMMHTEIHALKIVII